MADKESKVDWVKIITALAFVGLAAFGFSSYLKFKKEEEARINAQNEIARQSKVIQESEDTWSRLAQQKDDAIDDLSKENKNLADKIKDRNETVLVLSQAVAKFKSIRVIVQDPTQTEENGRVRVAFNQTVDPINVAGFTLTNPAEAQLDVNFVRPLKLTTVVTQAKDGSWRSYFSSDWDGLTIESIETKVNPNPLGPKSFVENIIIGASAETSFSFDGIGADAFVLYDFQGFALGPKLGMNAYDGYSAGTLGLMFQWAPWRK